MKQVPYKLYAPEKTVDAVEDGEKPAAGAIAFDVDRDLVFNTADLESYALSALNPVIYDAFILAASVEYADRSIMRPSTAWRRDITLNVPVHDPQNWNDTKVLSALTDVLSFLTGDKWIISFKKRKQPASLPKGGYLPIPSNTHSILAFSDGMDSRAVAGIVGSSLGQRLVRVRVGSKTYDRPSAREPFTAIPYSITFGRGNKDSTARSRGFKFALVTAIAAHLTDAQEIVIPESGQGAIGPAIVKVGHAYPDFRNHPQFTYRMERFVAALFGSSARYVFPRLWFTKGETLKAYVDLTGEQKWRDTKSCWRGNQWSSVNKKYRQCGACAACLLRRLSVHAAGFSEPNDTYICEDIGAASLSEAVEKSFSRRSAAFDQYAIAAALHLDHFAALAGPDSVPHVRRHALLLSQALNQSQAETFQNLQGLVSRHANEWKLFREHAGDRSYLNHWTAA